MSSQFWQSDLPLVATQRQKNLKKSFTAELIGRSVALVYLRLIQAEAGEHFLLGAEARVEPTHCGEERWRRKALRKSTKSIGVNQSVGAQRHSAAAR